VTLTTVLILFAVGLPVTLLVGVTALAIVVHRQGVELATLRRWRHDEVVPRSMHHGERLACLEMRTGLPVQDDLPAKLRAALTRAQA